MKKHKLIVSVFLYIFLLGNVAAAQGRFTPQQLGLVIKFGNIDRSKLNGSATIAADFNHDNLEDVIKLEASKLNYYINEGNGYLVHSKSIDAGSAYKISLVNAGDYQQSVMLENADKSVRIISERELNKQDDDLNRAPFITSSTDEFNFNEVWHSPVGYRSLYNCIATDIDNDGRNEIIFSGRSDTLSDCYYTYIYVLESNGDNNYVLDWDTTYPTSGGNGACIARIDLMDIDTDGHKEICFADHDAMNYVNYLKFLECYGPGQYRIYSSNIQSFWSAHPGLGENWKMVECDVNHDGVKELVHLHSFSSTSYDATYIQVCSFAYKTSTQFIFNPIKLVVYQSFCYDLDVGDINGDGKDEIILGGASFPSQYLSYFDSTGTGIIWGGNGGAGYEFKWIYTGRNMGAAVVRARDINFDNKKEWLLSAIGQGFGGFAVVSHLHDSIFNTEMYDTSLPNVGGIEYYSSEFSNYVFYPRTKIFQPNNTYRSYLHVFKNANNFMFNRVYDLELYPYNQGFGFLNILDMDNDNKVNIVHAKWYAYMLPSNFISDFENEYVIGITNNQLPVKFELHQNYPNPFNPRTIIKFQIPDSRFVTLKVYDILGREAATLINTKKTAGSYEVEFDGSNLASGVYFYRIEAVSNAREKIIASKKMVLIR